MLEKQIILKQTNFSIVWECNGKKIYEGENTFGLGFFDVDVIPLKDNKNNVGWLSKHTQNNFLNHLDKEFFLSFVSF